MDAPSQEEIYDVAALLIQNHDVARIPDVLSLAAFSLMVRYPASGARHFGNDEIPMLANRNPAVIKDVLELLPDTTKTVIAAITPAKAAKSPTKKDKTP